MSQVSYRQLNPEVKEKVYKILFDTIHSFSRKELEAFLNDFLSPTEKMVLAKRLAIAILLAKKYTHEQISHVLKVSESTVGSVALMTKIKGGGYDRAIKKFLRNETWRKFIDETIDGIFYDSPYKRKERNRREMRRKMPLY